MLLFDQRAFLSGKPVDAYIPKDCQTGDLRLTPRIQSHENPKP